MHFQLPEPTHGWPSFAGEVAIVVIGVLIALGAQSLAERWHWSGEVRIANDGFREELGTGAGMAFERLIIQPCLRGRIRELSSLLAQSDGAWKASPMAVASGPYSNVMPVAYRGPTRLLPTDRWKNAIANGTLNHLPSDRVRELSSLYGQISQFSDLHGEEAKAAARLTPLAFDRQLDAGSRTNMLASLVEADRINSLMAIQANQIMEAVRALGLRFPKAEVEERRRQVVADQRALRGSCVANLQLDLG